MGFVDKHEIWSADQIAALADITKAAQSLDTIRLSFADQHGILRGKTIVADELSGMLRSGCTMTSTLLAKDTSHRTVFPVFSAGGGFGLREMQGAADLLMVPDPLSFRTLPWAPRTGWMLCDLYFADGRPVPFSTRNILRTALDRLDGHGLDFCAGLEVEFHVYRLLDPKLRPEDAGQPGAPPEVQLISQGYQYLTEQRYDQIEPVMEMLRSQIVQLGLPLRSLEIEYGPSQCEFTFKPSLGLACADNMVLLRSAVKQICRRNGYHATFMARPRMPEAAASGWHLHQSLVHKDSGKNAFMAQEGSAQPLSPLGMQYLAGLERHALASAVFSTPTINGYKRYRSYSLAPDRANWGCDNRGVMLRVLGQPGDPASRIENRIGEPVANPYLYCASQIHAGLAGVEGGLEPGPSADTPYESEAPLLPKSLSDALLLLEQDSYFRETMGSTFVDYFAHIKRAELARYEMEVSEWEHREYFSEF